jgi:2-polyprenyl-6-hydroxyphenyl methylase/3-demethylubiquinone-9 3-methyltransferase
MTNVDPGEIARFDAAAERWWDPRGDMKPLHELNPLRLRFVDERAPLAGRQVLDVGCGGGLLAEAMARAGAQVTALDLSTELLAVARLHAQQSGVVVDYREVPVETLAADRPGSFATVTCMEMLEHVPDPASVVDSVARLLRPGGDAFFSTLNRTPRAYLQAVLGAEYLLRLLPRGTHSYERFIRPSELEAWCRAAGLELLEIAGIEYDPFAGSARLSRDARVNYLVHARRRA